MSTTITLEVGSPITMQESTRLVELEAVVKAGLQTFVQVGEALFEIKEKRLYRIEHDTFEGYCSQKWKMSRIQAHRLIGASEVSRMLPTGNKPENERQARPLTKLPSDQQPEAWAKAVESADGKQPTAKQVEAAVVQLLAPSPISPEGIVFAEKAIKWLCKIKQDDAERKKGLKRVSDWLKIHFN